MYIMGDGRAKGVCRKLSLSNEIFQYVNEVKRGCCKGGLEMLGEAIVYNATVQMRRQLKRQQRYLE
jgi:hypothetical protein